MCDQLSEHVCKWISWIHENILEKESACYWIASFALKHLLYHTAGKPSELAAIVLFPLPTYEAAVNAGKALRDSAWFDSPHPSCLSQGGSALIESAPLRFISTGGIRRASEGSERGRVVSQTHQEQRRRQTNRQPSPRSFPQADKSVCVSVGVCMFLHLISCMLCAHIVW